MRHHVLKGFSVEDPAPGCSDCPGALHSCSGDESRYFATIPRFPCTSHEVRRIITAPDPTAEAGAPPAPRTSQVPGSYSSARSQVHGPSPGVAFVPPAAAVMVVAEPSTAATDLLPACICRPMLRRRRRPHRCTMAPPEVSLAIATADATEDPPPAVAAALQPQRRPRARPGVCGGVGAIAAGEFFFFYFPDRGYIVCSTSQQLPPLDSKRGGGHC